MNKLSTWNLVFLNSGWCRWYNTFLIKRLNYLMCAHWIVNMERQIMRQINMDLYFHLWQKCCHKSTISMVLSKTMSQQQKEVLSKAYNFTKASCFCLPWWGKTKMLALQVKEISLMVSVACPKLFCIKLAERSWLKMALLQFALWYTRIADLFTLQQDSSAMYNSSSFLGKSNK